ncbi:MAG: fimbria major subunit, partial [Rikenellaceae bacterium]
NLAEKENFYKYYDRSFNFDQPLATTAPSKYVYISENTNNKQVIGNTTYLAVEAVYTPVKVTTECTYNPAGDGEFQIKEGPLATGVTTFSKINLAGGAAFPLKNNLFADVAIATSILKAVLAANNYKEGGTPTEAAAFTAEFKKRFSTYTDGKSYYRLNVGNIITEGPNTGQINYGIRRNSQYQITINSFKQLGVATPGELDDNPEIPVSSQGTYVTATIVVAGWEEYTQNGDL